MRLFSNLLLGLILALPVALVAHGDEVHGKEWDLKKEDNLQAVGAPEAEFEGFPAKNVEGLAWQLNWATAACVQSVANYQDLFVEQQDLMKRIFGKAEDQPKSISKIRRRINEYAPVNNKNETRRHLHARKFKVIESRIVDDLRKHGPVIVFIEDPAVNREVRAVILLQVHFKYGYQNNEEPQSVILYDPYPDPLEMRKQWSWYDFKNAVRGAFRLDVHER